MFPAEDSHRSRADVTKLPYMVPSTRAARSQSRLPRPHAPFNKRVPTSNTRTNDPMSQSHEGLHPPVKINSTSNRAIPSNPPILPNARSQVSSSSSQSKKRTRSPSSSPDSLSLNDGSPGYSHPRKLSRIGAAPLTKSSSSLSKRGDPSINARPGSDHRELKMDIFGQNPGVSDPSHSRSTTRVDSHSHNSSSGDELLLSSTTPRRNSSPRVQPHTSSSSSTKVLEQSTASSSPPARVPSPRMYTPEPPEGTYSDHSSSSNPEYSPSQYAPRMLDENYGFIGEEFAIGVHSRSPSPDTVYHRRFTELGRRRPTPRKIILPGEGDLSAMGRTTYFEGDTEEHIDSDDDGDAALHKGRRRPKPNLQNLLAGLDGDDSELQPGQHDEGEGAFGETGNVSGYQYNPTGFTVLDQEEEDLSRSPSSSSNRGDVSAPLPPVSSSSWPHSPQLPTLFEPTPQQPIPSISSMPSSSVSSTTQRPEWKFGRPIAPRRTSQLKSEARDQRRKSRSSFSFDFVHRDDSITMQPDVDDQLSEEGDFTVDADADMHSNGGDAADNMDKDEEPAVEVANALGADQNLRSESDPRATPQHRGRLAPSTPHVIAPSPNSSDGEPTNRANITIQLQSPTPLIPRTRPSSSSFRNHIRSQQEQQHDQPENLFFAAAGMSTPKVLRSSPLASSAPSHQLADETIMEDEFDRQQREEGHRRLLVRQGKKVSPDERRPATHDDVEVEDDDSDTFDDGMGYDDDDDDRPIIQLMSDDPKAAARAAVILKTHYPYILEHAGPRRPRSRSGSRSRQGSGISIDFVDRGHQALDSSVASKGSQHTRPHPHPRMKGIAADPSVLELLQETEHEYSQSIRLSPSKPRTYADKNAVTPPNPPGPSANDPFYSKMLLHPEFLDDSSVPRPRSPVRQARPSKAVAKSTPKPRSSNQFSESDWADLERAFVHERRAIAKQRGLTSSREIDPGLVNLEAVVHRFIDMPGKPQSGPGWTFEDHLARAELCRRALRKQFSRPRANTPTPLSRNPSTVPQTPSTFGEDILYDRRFSDTSSNNVSRSGSLHEPLTRPQYGSLQEEANTIAGVSMTEPVPLPGLTGRLFSMLGFGARASSIPASEHDTTQSDTSLNHDRSGPAPRSNERLPSVTQSDSGAISSYSSKSTSTPSETKPYQRGAKIMLAEPLRRASVAPMRDRSVSILREVEERPILRRSGLLNSRPTSSALPIPRARQASGSSVKELVRSFEDLSDESIRMPPPPSRSASAQGRYEDGGDSRTGSAVAMREPKEEEEDVHMLDMSEMQDYNVEGDLSRVRPRTRIPPTAPPPRRMTMGWEHNA